MIDNKKILTTSLIMTIVIVAIVIYKKFGNKDEGTLNGIDQSSFENNYLGLETFSEQYYNNLGSLGNASNKAYDYITGNILKMIEKEKNLFWRKPWKLREKFGLYAQNYITKKPYNGINSFMLNFVYPTLRNKDFDLPYFLTFNQIKERKGKLKKGSKGYRVHYFSVIYKEGKKKLSQDAFYKRVEELRKQGKDPYKELDSYAFLKYYTVFNAEDIQEIDFIMPKPVQKPKDREVEKREMAESILDNMPLMPPIVYRDPNRAYYSPGMDLINMPLQQNFISDNEFYSTFFHELSHSTKHKKRLDDNTRGGSKGTKAYAFEELIAELSACFLCGESGIFFDVLQKNSAAYLKGWKARLTEAMKDDNKFFIKAAGKAQKSADYILDRDKEGIPKYIREDKILVSWRIKNDIPGILENKEVPSNEDKILIRSKPVDMMANKQLSLFGINVLA